MNAPPFPANPAVGEFFGNWTWNGVRWVCSPAAGVRVVTQVIAASGPYMPSPGLVTAVVETIGGGGGGGAVSPLPSAAMIVCGPGGGSGGYSRITLAAALVAGGVQVTIGAGGASNSNGEATSFGALCVANGGAGGGIADNVGNVSGGMGAVPGVGDIVFAGTTGGNGFILNLDSASGQTAAGSLGGTIYGGNRGAFDVAPGDFDIGFEAYGNTGAGGGGAVVNQLVTSTTALGGNGGSGICIVTEYCWSDSAADSDCDGTVNVNARVAIERDQWGSGRTFKDQQGFDPDD